ncbi:MAG: penicillin-binding transpeptidase domain-containing protein [Chloroflexota bacterium]
MPKRRHILVCLIILVVSACTARPGASPFVQSTPSQPTTRLSMDDAQRLAADFLNAWKLDRYDAMYTMLTLNSRDAIAFKDFEQIYTDAEQTMTLLPNGKSYALTNAIQQDTSVEIAYDMTFDTKLVGKFSDMGRTLRLASTSDGWRVAWSKGDVFAEMKDGGALDVVETSPNRANIYDRDGEVIADQNGTSITVKLLTKSYPTGNPDECYAELARVFKVRTADAMKNLYGDRTGRDFAFEIGDLSQERFATEKAALERVCTLDYTTRPTRRYVAGGLAPHIVGYVGRIPAETVDDWIARGYSQDALVGIDGIERNWEDTLAGKGPAQLIIRLRDGTVRKLAERPGIPSQSVYLTLDRKLQENVQNTLKDTFAAAPWGKWATGAAAIVMDVHTGEILAIASYPDFNVDAFNPNTSLKDAQTLIDQWSKDPRKPTFNRATLGIYPPGSVFKIVSMAAAADSGKFKVNTPYTCTGLWNGTPLGDRTRYDWIYHTQAGQHGTITLQQALTGSCDVYFWHVGWTLNQADPHILLNYARRMGFGAKTGIKDVSEDAGNLPDPDTYETIDGTKWRGSDALNIAIGQGDIQVTPLQVVRMVAAIANGGTLYQPLLVQKVGILGDPPSYVAKPVANGKLGLKPEVIKGIQRAMCDVTTNQTLGTATFIFQGLKGAVVCGKTGTAETVGEPHAWFAAYAGKTADTPDIAIVVVVEHSNEGSYVAAPLVRHIVEMYYGLDLTPSWFQGALPTLISGD